MAGNRWEALIRNRSLGPSDRPAPPHHTPTPLDARDSLEERWRAAIEAAPCGIVVVDGDGVIAYANSYVEKLFGYSRTELVGQRIDALVPPRSRSVHADFRKEFLAAPQARAMGAGRDLSGLRKDGAEIPVEIGLSPFTTAAGTLVLAWIVDITERKRQEARERELHKQIKDESAKVAAVNKELEAFSYSVSHDLRAPLRVIDGFSRILLQDHAEKLDAEGRRVIDVIRQGTQTMGKLIEDLLNFSRMGRKELRMASVDMVKLARQTLAEVLGAHPERKVETVVGTLPPVTGDPALLRQLWTNLLANAVKYSRTRAVAHIEVGGRVQEMEHTYYVKDDGVGFDMQYAKKLFGVFQRLHPSEDFEGTGIGLALVKRIVERHGGRVWAEGAENVGATFYFALPGGSGDAGRE